MRTRTPRRTWTGPVAGWPVSSTSRTRPSTPPPTACPASSRSAGAPAPPPPPPRRAATPGTTSCRRRPLSTPFRQTAFYIFVFHMPSFRATERLREESRSAFPISRLLFPHLEEQSDERSSREDFSLRSKWGMSLVLSRLLFPIPRSRATIDFIEKTSLFVRSGE
ncbi:MAG: hypothetical protein UU63_C0017G0009 [Candidatus Uhrbacteria bacterium GW2011_GWF2_41_430]|nr:MAG: hypothetical protein UU63_C0017G0009 [Candidatus Uhrbacteria bacterium GW2011_GWF2_41_430]